MHTHTHAYIHDGGEGERERVGGCIQSILFFYRLNFIICLMRPGLSAKYTNQRMQHILKAKVVGPSFSKSICAVFFHCHMHFKQPGV